MNALPCDPSKPYDAVSTRAASTVTVPVFPVSRSKTSSVTVRPLGRKTVFTGPRHTYKNL